MSIPVYLCACLHGENNLLKVSEVILREVWSWLFFVDLSKVVETFRRVNALVKMDK